MNLASNLLPESLIHALGWTIVHSLWQGTAIAVVLGIILTSMKRTASKSRYFISVLFLSLLISLTVITFLNYYDSYNVHEVKAAIIGNYKSAGIPAASNPESVSFFKKFTILSKSILEWSSQYHKYITVVWLAGIFLLLIRLSAGLIYTNFYRQKSTEAAPDFQNMADIACEKLNYKSQISVFKSTYAKVPVVIGYFKPVILLPVGIFTGMTYEQIELIFAHEIAHIIRKDFLINILLTAAEIIFFYNPAVLWISSRIKQERENCCDDLALTLTNHPVTYAEALAAILENSISAPSYSLGLFSRKSEARKRIERIIKHPKIQPAFYEGTTIVIVLIISLFITINARTNSRPQTYYAKSISQSDTAKTVSTFKKPFMKKQGSGSMGGDIISTGKKVYKSVKLEWKNDFITLLSIEGNVINPEDYEKYQDLIFFDLKMPSFALNLSSFDSGRDSSDGEYQANEFTLANKTYRKVKMVKKDNAVVYLSIEGKKISKTDYGIYSDLINWYAKK